VLVTIRGSTGKVHNVPDRILPLVLRTLGAMRNDAQFERDLALLNTFRANLRAIENLQRVPHDYAHVTRIALHLQFKIRELEQKLRQRD